MTAPRARSRATLVPQRIAVLGAGGFIGSHLVPALLAPARLRDLGGRCLFRQAGDNRCSGAMHPGEPRSARADRGAGGSLRSADLADRPVQPVALQHPPTRRDRCQLHRSRPARAPVHPATALAHALLDLRGVRAGGPGRSGAGHAEHERGDLGPVAGSRAPGTLDLRLCQAAARAGDLRQRPSPRAPLHHRAALQRDRPAHGFCPGHRWRGNSSGAGQLHGGAPARGRSRAGRRWTTAAFVRLDRRFRRGGGAHGGAARGLPGRDLQPRQSVQRPQHRRPGRGDGPGLPAAGSRAPKCARAA